MFSRCLLFSCSIDVDGGSESFNDQFYESAPECIICQLKEAKEGDMLGYIGFCQRSRVHSRYGVRRSCGEELCSASDGSDEVGVKAGLGMSSADSDDDSRVETPQPISTCTDTSTSHTNSHGQQKDNVLLNAIAVAEQLNPLEIHCTHKDSAFDNCDSGKRRILWPNNAICILADLYINLSSV